MYNQHKLTPDLPFQVQGRFKDEYLQGFIQKIPIP